MVVVIKKGSEERQLNNLISWVKGLGLDVNRVDGENSTILGLVGDTSVVDIDLINSIEIVDKVQRIQEPYKAANRKFHPDDTVIKVGDNEIGGKNFTFIAGPCSVESEEQIVEVAKAVKAAGATVLRGGAFKPRTSPYAFQGLKDAGIRLLLEAKKQTGMPIITEIMTTRTLELFQDVEKLTRGSLSRRPCCQLPVLFVPQKLMWILKQ